MATTNEMGNALHSFMQDVMAAAQSLQPAPAEFLIFNNPKEDELKWYFLIFFPNAEAHHAALHNGICYQIHQYIWNTLSETQGYTALQKTIAFDSGTVPKNENDILSIFSQMIAKNHQLLQEQGQTPSDNCHICGHSFDKHQANGFSNEASEIATEGWMTCPETGCTCFRTWSATIVS